MSQSYNIVNYFDKMPQQLKNKNTASNQTPKSQNKLNRKRPIIMYCAIGALSSHLILV
jgi:3-mercaptopyruvate sulfurtransferase SseA